MAKYSRKKIEGNTLRDAVKALPDWTTRDDKLFREFKFADFNEAFGFMTRAALIAEQMDHHPEWFNVYSTVSVHLTTHDVGGITELDTVLASAMDRIAG